MNLLDLLSGNTKPGGAIGQALGQTTPSGLAGFLQNAQSPAAMASQPSPSQPHPGDRTRRIVGIIGDALAGLNGQPGPYAAMMQRQRELQQQSQLEQQRWQQQQAWKDLHPDPTDLQRKAEYLNSIKPGLGDTYLGNEADPYKGIQTTDPTTGQPSIQLYRPGSLGSQGGSGSPAPVRVNGPEDVARLPVGAQFIAPDGTVRIKHGGAGPAGPQTFR